MKQEIYKLIGTIIKPIEPAVKWVMKVTLGRNKRLWAKLKAHRLEMSRALVTRTYLNGVRQRLGDPSAKPFGVNLSGFLTSEKGLGAAVRGDALALESASIPFVLNAAHDPGSRSIEDIEGKISETNPYSFNLLHMNADQTDDFAHLVGAQYFYDHYNIGYWAWELSVFPDTWQGVTDYYDEIWCPSTFIRDAVSQKVSVPVIAIPTAMPSSLPTDPLMNRAYFGIPERRFVFLFIFDFSSYMVRKNPLGLIEAFKKAGFKENEAVLVIKCTHGEDYPEDLSLLREAVVPGVQLIDRLMSRIVINSLMALSDCYVSLHRAEGFGLTIAEAMVAGKPVIATGYSGNLDFADEANSFLVDYDLVEIEQDHNVYKKGALWAQPRVEHAAELMTAVFEQRDEAAQKGLLGQKDVRSKLGVQAVGRMMRERLRKIAI